ncbi:MAG: hypothetical protein AAB393_08095, partial [Bacteroidota bacterium]
MMKRILYILLGVTLGLAQLAAQVSRNGNYHFRTEIGLAAKKYPEKTSWMVSVYNKAGAREYTIAKEVPYDVGFPAVYLADDGACVVVSSFNGMVEFYASDGYVVGTLAPFPSPLPDYERTIYCSVADEQAAFAVSESHSSSARLLLTDLRGNRIWDRPLEGKSAGGVFLSDKGSYVLACSYSSDGGVRRSSVLLNATGELLRMFNTLFRTADISEESGHLVLADRNDVLIASLEMSGAEAWWRTRKKENVVTAVKCSAGFVAAVVESVSVESGAPIYHNPNIVVLNGRGEVLLTRSLHGSSGQPSSIEMDAEALRL